MGGIAPYSFIMQLWHMRQIRKNMGRGGGAPYSLNLCHANMMHVPYSQRLQNDFSIFYMH